MLTCKRDTSRKPARAIKYIVLCLVPVMVCSGCGSSRGKLFGELDEPVVWPEPPEQARIQYLGELSTEDDLKREVSGMAALGRFIFGQEDIGVLVSPRGLALDDEERLFIADTSGGVVHIMDLKTRKYEQFYKLEGDETLLSPVGVVVVGNDVYVSDSALGKICVFSTEGKYKFSFGSDTLERPSGIAYNGRQQTIYVADTKRHMIDIFDMQGRHIIAFGGRGGGQGFFSFPTYVWIDKEGKLYVSDTLNYRVQVFGADGKFLRAIGGHGDRPGYFAHPCGIATDSHGNIYVGDKQFENIQIFDSTGQILMAVGGEGHGPGEFWLPTGIFIDDKNRIFVADSFNKRVQVFQLIEEETP